MSRHFVIAATSVLAVSALPVMADTYPIPSQNGWVDAKKEVTLESGLQLSYVEMGPSDGQPVLLLHGYTDNSRSWSLLAPYLNDRHLIAVDLRGHGDSDSPACCYDINTLASDVNGFMDKLGIETADVIGHSLGSMTAATLAGYHPERVDELVLISTSAYLPEAATEWLWENLPAMERPIDPESEFMMNWYWNPTAVDENFISRERAESAATPESTWMGVLEGLTITDWTQLANHIEAPTLILWGDQDGLFKAESQAHIRAILPDAKHITYEGHGHNMFWEIPEQTGTDISNFLSK